MIEITVVTYTLSGLEVNLYSKKKEIQSVNNLTFERVGSKNQGSAQRRVSDVKEGNHWALRREGNIQSHAF